MWVRVQGCAKATAATQASKNRRMRPVLPGWGHYKQPWQSDRQALWEECRDPSSTRSGTVVVRGPAIDGDMPEASAWYCHNRPEERHAQRQHRRHSEIVYTLALKYLYRDYIKANVYTIWVHGPFGVIRPGECPNRNSEGGLSIHIGFGAVGTACSTWRRAAHEVVEVDVLGFRVWGVGCRILCFRFWGL